MLPRYHPCSPAADRGARQRTNIRSSGNGRSTVGAYGAGFCRPFGPRSRTYSACFPIPAYTCRRLSALGRTGLLFPLIAFTIGPMLPGPESAVKGFVPLCFRTPARSPGDVYLSPPVGIPVSCPAKFPRGIMLELLRSGMLMAESLFFDQGRRNTGEGHVGKDWAVDGDL